VPHDIYFSEQAYLHGEPPPPVTRITGTLPTQPPDLHRTVAHQTTPSGRYDAWREEAFVTAWILGRLRLA
jgi:oligopeptidase B